MSRHFESQGVDKVTLQDFQSTTGKGVSSRYEGTTYYVGSRNFISAHNIAVSASLHERADAWLKEAATVVEKMKTLKFKTNINCSGCIRAVTPHLEKADGIKTWKVDTENPDKILTVEAEGAQAQDVKQVVEQAGFKAEEIGGL